jgi:hypothetical protein
MEPIATLERGTCIGCREPRPHWERRRDARTHVPALTGVMAGLDPAIHANTDAPGSNADTQESLHAPLVFAWMPGSSPGHDAAGATVRCVVPGRVMRMRPMPLPPGPPRLGPEEGV